MTLSDITNKALQKRKELDDFTRGMICGLAYLANWKQVDIAKKLDLGTSTVHSIVKKYKEEGLKGPKPRSGRPKVLKNRDGRSLALNVRRAPTDPMGIHSQNLRRTRGAVALPTVRKKLREKGFFSFKIVKNPFLGLSHRRRRKLWVSLRQHCTMQQWKKVIWSDESRFRLRHNDGGMRVIRNKGEKLLDQRIDKRRSQITTLDELDAALHEEWELISMEICYDLVSSMPERCKAVKKAHGGYTKY